MHHDQRMGEWEWVRLTEIDYNQGKWEEINMELSEARKCVKAYGRSGIEEVMDLYKDEGVLLAALKCEVEDINNSYEGQHNSDMEFTKELLGGCEPLLDQLFAYVHVDWESTTEDVMADYNECDGYYFRA